jgi:hypothetical protein
MVDAFDERSIIGVPTAFQSFFGRPETGGRTLFSDNEEIVDIDIVRGTESLAAFIERGTNADTLAPGHTVTADRSTSFSRMYPLGELVSPISAKQILKREPGENPFENRERLQRLRSKGLASHQEHVRRFVRSFEYLCARSILDGRMPSRLNNSSVDLTYDFRRNSEHNITLATPWDADGADIIADIENCCKKIRANGHVNPDMAIFGGAAADVFVKNGIVKELSDNRRFELIELNSAAPLPPTLQRFSDKLTLYGRIRTPRGYALWMFVYNDVYTDDNGEPQTYMPEDQVMICNSQARCDRYFGPADVLPSIPSRERFYTEVFGFAPSASLPPQMSSVTDVISSNMFHFDAMAGEDWKNVKIRTQTAPIFATTQTDAFATLRNIVAKV